MMTATFARSALFRTLEGTRYGGLHFVTPEGESFFFSGDGDGAQAHMHLHDWKAVTALILRGDIGFAETYRDGMWDSDDLEALMSFGLQNQSAMDNMVYGAPIFRVLSRLSYLFKLNTLRGSKKNISAHYDLGNAFYRLWLDDTMTYSSALFEEGVGSLSSAQHRKYDRLLDRLQGASGDILEIGCGWGGFAERAVEKGDHRVRGLTLSSEQYNYARERLEPMKEQTEILLEDYRLQDKKYDNIVSIEMFEAVGERYWDTYFQKISHCLKPNGKALIQTITIDDRHFESYRKSGDMIRTFIFPGGMLPSWERFEKRAQAAGLKMTERFAFGTDYAQTLRLWLAKFTEQEQSLDMMGFDNRFRRLWKLYLAGCAASFAVERTDVMQMELVHA